MLGASLAPDDLEIGVTPRRIMAKSLGQIHTVNWDAKEFTTTGDKYLCDASQELTQQLSHMVRNSNSFKLVGLDLICTQVGGTGPASVSGSIRYFSPSKGRVQAYKDAYHAIRRGMRLNGVNVRQNKQYDFRVALADLSTYLNGPDFVNIASIAGGGAPGNNGQLVLSAEGITANSKSVFSTYNLDRQPVSSGTPTFSAGYNILSPSGSISDFVDNEGLFWDGMKNEANDEWEEIPFQLSWTPTSDDTAFTFQWRPDPALYVSLMMGQFEIVLDEIDSSSEPVRIEIAAHFAGWKSMVANQKTGRKKRGRRKRR